jgi:hypothetical protein
VRFSVWDESGEAQAAISIDEEEAAHLAAFLRPTARPSGFRDAIDRLVRHATAGSPPPRH